MSTDSFPGPERRIGALDLPPDTTAEVAALLSIAAGPPIEDELAGETAAVAAFLAQRGEQPSPRRRITARAVRVAAAALITTVVLGGGLAAADVLPTPAQRWVSHALGSVGIDVPSPDPPSSDAPAYSPAPNEQLRVPGPAGLPQGAPGASRPSSTTSGPDGSLPGAAIIPGDPAFGAALSDGQAGTGATADTSTGDANGSNPGQAKGAGSSSGSGTPGSKARSYGSGGNPAPANGQAKKPASSSGSAARGKPTDPGASTPARSTPPGQIKKDQAAQALPAVQSAAVQSTG